MPVASSIFAGKFAFMTAEDHVEASAHDHAELRQATAHPSVGLPAEISVDGLPLTWVDHPARNSPLKLAFTTFVVLLCALGLVMLEGSVPLALAGVVILLAAISPFLLPTRFTLNQQGVTQRSRLTFKQRPWQDLKRWQEDRNGILVSPFRAASWLDEVRGIYLRGGPREEIRRILQQKLGEKTPLP